MIIGSFKSVDLPNYGGRRLYQYNEDDFFYLF